jgi:hypothetical protein
LKKVKIDILYQNQNHFIKYKTILNQINLKFNSQQVYLYCQFVDIVIFGNNIDYTILKSKLKKINIDIRNKKLIAKNKYQYLKPKSKLKKKLISLNQN